MSQEIRVAVLKVEDKELTVNNNFNPSLENMQSAVGGYIEAVTIREDAEGRRLTLWINEEGKLTGLEPNFAIVEEETNQVLDIVVGDVFITSSNDEGDTVGLNDEELEYIRNKFNFNQGVITYNNVINRLFYV